MTPCLEILPLRSPFTFTYLTKHTINNMEQRQKPAPYAREKDCLYVVFAAVPLEHFAYQLKISSCRLTGAAAFSGLGLYALYQGRQQGAFQRIKPKGSPVIAGQLSVVLGLGEWKVEIPSDKG